MLNLVRCDRYGTCIMWIFPIGKVECLVELLQATLVSGFEFRGSFRAVRTWFNFVGKGSVGCFSNFAAFEALCILKIFRTA